MNEQAAQALAQEVLGYIKSTDAGNTRGWFVEVATEARTGEIAVLIHAPIENRVPYIVMSREDWEHVRKDVDRDQAELERQEAAVSEKGGYTNDAPPPAVHERVLGQAATRQKHPSPFGQAWIQDVPPITIGAALTKLYRNAYGPAAPADIAAEIAAIERACLMLQQMLDRYHQDIQNLEARISALESGS